MSKNQELEHSLSIFHYKLDIKRELYGSKSVRNVVLKVSEAETVYKHLQRYETLQAEHEALKRDVVRFMYLLSKENTTNKESFEVVTLGEKLSKVGKEE